MFAVYWGTILEAVVTLYSNHNTVCARYTSKLFISTKFLNYVISYINYIPKQLTFYVILQTSPLHVCTLRRMVPKCFGTSQYPTT